MECKICLTQYNLILKTPYSLYPCNHTFCSECLTNMELCPTCETKIEDKKPNNDSIGILKSSKNDLDFKINNSFYLMQKLNSQLDASMKYRTIQKDKIKKEIKFKIDLLNENITNEIDTNDDTILDKKQKLLEELDKLKIDLDLTNELENLNDLDKKIENLKLYKDFIQSLNTTNKTDFLFNQFQHKFCFECLYKLEDQECRSCKLEISDKQFKDELIDSSQKIEDELKNEIELKLNDSFEKVSTFEARLKDNITTKDKLKSEIKIKIIETFELLQSKLQDYEKHVNKIKDEIIVTLNQIGVSYSYNDLKEISNFIKNEYDEKFKKSNAQKQEIVKELTILKNELKITDELNNLRNLNEKLTNMNIEFRINRIEKLLNDNFEFIIANIKSVSNNKNLEIFKNRKNSIITYDNEVLNSIKCMKTLEEHTKSVYTLISLTDNIIASGSGDHKIKLWNLNEGQCIKTLNGHTDVVSCLALLSNNRFVSSSYDNTIRIWSLDKGECIKIITENNDLILPKKIRLKKNIYSLTVLPDDQIISGSFESIKIWDSNTGKCLKTLDANASYVRSLALISNDKLASGYENNMIKIWDLKNYECLTTLNEHKGSVRSLVVFSNNNIISGSDDRMIKIWDLTSGKCIRTLVGHNSSVFSLAIISNRLLSGSKDKNIKIWNIESGECLTKTTINHMDSVRSLIVLPTKDRILSASDDKTIKLWSLF